MGQFLTISLQIEFRDRLISFYSEQVFVLDSHKVEVSIEDFLKDFIYF